MSTPGNPVNADSVFQPASLSKPIGATVVAKLVGKAKSRGTRESAISIPILGCTNALN
ncbi:MAG: serine hydrolase [Verrucomicrobia bacterium]|nr:serine hydrolase [Verrucomicrobiota bacterium]